jgi:chorismate mutase / prephenate dehydratase
MTLKEKRLHYLGPIGTFSEGLAKRLYPGYQFEQHPTINSICLAISKSTDDLALIPIENSQEGSVNESLSSYVMYDLFIQREIELQVNQCFFSMGDDIAKIQSLVSHPQSLGQCRQWIEANFPNVAIVPTSSNAEGMVLASKDPEIGAIGSSHAGNLYGLNLISENIQDADFNVTKFNLVSSTHLQVDNYNKTSIILSLPDDQGAGSLIEVLKPFALRGIPLTKIVSRPTSSSNWNYYFFIDFLGYFEEVEFNSLIRDIKKSTSYFKLLGSYQKSHEIM